MDPRCGIIAHTKNRLFDFFRQERNCVEPKFMCPTHSKAKQMETSKFGAEKGLFQRPSRENRQVMLKRPKLPVGFQRRVFKSKIWGEGCAVHDFLLIG